MLCLLGNWMLDDSNVKLTTDISYLNLGADPLHSEAFHNDKVSSLTVTQRFGHRCVDRGKTSRSVRVGKMFARCKGSSLS